MQQMEYLGLIFGAGVDELCDGGSGALGDVLPGARAQQADQHGNAPGRAHRLPVRCAAGHQVRQRFHRHISRLRHKNTDSTLCLGISYQQRNVPTT